jgi:hypothetical protein
MGEAVGRAVGRVSERVGQTLGLRLLTLAITAVLHTKSLGRGFVAAVLIG